MPCAYQLRTTQQDNKNTKKLKILEKLFRENKTSPLLKTPEKDFQDRAYCKPVPLSVHMLVYKWEC